MALRRILFSNDTFSAQQIYQSMIMSIFTHCGYNSLGWSESRKSMIRSIEKRSAKSFPRNAVRSIGVRAIFCQGGGGGNPFAQKIIASCPNFYETVERKLGPCNKIGRTGTWKWLDTVFQSQYLPSLSINFVATNKHLEKIATTVVLDKQGNLSWLGLQWHRSCHSNEMTPLPYSTCSNISHW